MKTMMTVSRSATIAARAALLLLLGTELAACSLLQKQGGRPDDPLVSVAQEMSSQPMPPEKAEAVLGEMGDSWLFGQGLGKTALNVGAIYMFPPYALYVVGNSVLSYAGYEPLYVTNLLPAEEKREVSSFYDKLTAAPGKVSAALAGKEYRTKESATARIKLITEPEAERERAPAPGPIETNATQLARADEGLARADDAAGDPPPAPKVP
jgi:hypothetical protein